jgi:hypothetical protein
MSGEGNGGVSATAMPWHSCSGCCAGPKLPAVPIHSICWQIKPPPQRNFLCLEEAFSLVQLGPSSWRERTLFPLQKTHVSDPETYQVVPGYNLWAIDYGGSCELEE